MNAERALQLAKSRLAILPTSRIVNTDSWDAVRLGEVLDIVDRVLAEVRFGDAGPCSSVLPAIVGTGPGVWCALRQGHSGDHENPPTRWKELGSGGEGRD